MSCEFCKDWNNIRAAEEKLGYKIEYCPNCGEYIYVVYTLCMMKKAVDKCLELHLLDGKCQETVEIDGEKLVVEREKITNFGDPEMFTTEHRMSMKVDLDKVDISKEMEMLGLNYEPKEEETNGRN